jgi:hypothetical protein
MRVRPIRSSEIPVLQGFIREHWNASHTLAHSEALLRWQHANPFKAASGYASDELSFLGAWDGDELIAVLGEIPVPFTVRGRAIRGAWLALWKSRSASQPGIGLTLFARATEGPAAFVGAIGINERVRPSYRLLRYQLTDDLPMHLVLNPARPSQLVRRKEDWTQAAEERFRPRESRDSDQGPAVLPAPPAPEPWDRAWAGLRTQLAGVDRTHEYLRWRYLEHPHYRYQCLQALGKAGVIEGLAVYRIEPVAAVDERVVQVLELLGDPPARRTLAIALCGVMREIGASFLTFRCSHSPSLQAWRDAGGATYVRGDAALDVASLFQPVVPEYRPLCWAYRAKAALAPFDSNDLYITRSDGDQDRPSRLP